jgi:Rrf2 family protein
MIYSKMAEHAIAAMAELARQPEGERIATARIADAASIPRPILTKVVAELQHAGLVRTREGRYGGVRLAPSAATMSIREVADSFDTDVSLPECPFHPDGCNCHSANPCKAHALWTEARAAFDRFLDEVTIADVSEAVRKQPTS